MRKLMVVPLAGLLALALAAPVAAGPNVHNTSGGGEFIVAAWSEGNRSGYVELFQEHGMDGGGYLYEEFGTYAECEETGSEASIHDVPGDGSYGFQGTRVNGWAQDVDISLSRLLDSGSAEGTFELWIETVDECAGIFDGTYAVEPFRASLTGVGSAVRFRGFGSYQVPSEFNGHSSYRGTEREAIGSLALASLGNPTFDWAYMSEYSWTEHVNH